MVIDFVLVSVFTDTCVSNSNRPGMLCNNPDDELIIRLITNEPQAKTVTSVK